MNYLIIDDDDTFCSVLGRVLERKGHRVLSANTGSHAVKLCQDSCDIERVILDLKLEQESGLAILKSIKAILPDSEILMLTSYSSISTAVEAIKLGAINYLCKPASVDEILCAFSAPQITHSEVPIPTAPTSVNRLEWEHIQRVLNDNNGNISATARSLGMHRRTLQRKLQKKPTKQ